MKGTEKQVKWANEIKARVSAILSEGIELQKKLNPDNTANIQGFDAMRSIVTGFDGYAGEMITVFRDVRRTGDIQSDLSKVVMTARASRISPERSGELGKQLRALFGM